MVLINKSKIRAMVMLFFYGLGSLQPFAAWAAHVEDAMPIKSEPLALTPKEMAKLQHLFPNQNKDEYQHDILHEHVVWKQTPIDVILPVGVERMITFPTTIQFGYDKKQLDEEKLNVQNNGGVLYLTAKQAFTPQRVQVKCVASGQVILLNLSAQNEASHTPLDIVISSPQIKSTELATQLMEESNNAYNEKGVDGFQSMPITPVTLTRFAAQQLYAPKRLLVQSPAIYRVPMHTHKIIPLLLDGSVMSMPLASWRGGDLYVTAILLRNLLSQSLTLDPRNVCGAWQTTTFFPLTQLAPRGNTQDTTAVFLVSQRPFADSLKSCGL